MAPGYSGTPLPAKLGIKPGAVVCVLRYDGDYKTLVTPLGDGVKLVARPTKETDLVHLFTTRRSELETALPSLRRQLKPDAAVWVSWPKKASKVETDITEDTIREVALGLGFVDVKVCAVSEVWSGLKLVVRKELR